MPGVHQNLMVCCVGLALTWECMSGIAEGLESHQVMIIISQTKKETENIRSLFFFFLTFLMTSCEKAGSICKSVCVYTVW